jgi:hypothetical protein
MKIFLAPIVNFDFNFDLEYLRRVQSSEPLQTKMNLTACWDHGFRILSSYWLAHFYLIKKSAKVLLYLGLDCGMMDFSTYKPQSQEQLLTLPHFWSMVQRKRSRFVAIQPMIPTRRMIRGIFV